jgi:hypothetical protein
MMKKMSTRERPAAMEQLWDAISGGGNKRSSPAWHRTVLSDRRKRLNSTDVRFLSLDEIRERLR